MPIKQKIWLDTDIGDDIDDVLALYLGLHMPEIEIVGISTVFENTDLRARMAKKCVTLARRPIPVYAGIGTPDGGENFRGTKYRFCQYTPDLSSDEYAPVNAHSPIDGESAPDALLAAVARYGGALTVVAIGPLTNVAHAIRRAPDVMRQVGRVVFMGGSFYTQFREWNIVCDVEAAATVFSSDVPLECVGTDVTDLTEISRRDHDEYLSASGDDPLSAYLFECIRLWMDDYPRKILLHDPLTLYYCAHPEVLLMQEIPVYLETEGKGGRGMTFNCDNWFSLPRGCRPKRCLCAKSVNLKQFMDVICGLIDQHKVIQNKEAI